MTNSWMTSSTALAGAYDVHNSSLVGRLRQSLLTRAILMHLPLSPQRIVDVGGGEGYQALALARAGHEVVLVDPDSAMLASADRRLREEDASVRERVRIVQAYGEAAIDLVGGDFDLVCCHGILMYLDDPQPMLSSIVGLARPGGLISLLSKNADAQAMRPALERRWNDAIAALKGGRDVGGKNVTSRADRVAEVQTMLADRQATTLAWYGLRTFTDHFGAEPAGPDFDQICELEWIAGTLDPYRRVARLFHVVARKDSGTNS